MCFGHGDIYWNDIIILLKELLTFLINLNDKFVILWKGSGKELMLEVCNVVILYFVHNIAQQVAREVMTEASRQYRKYEMLGY